MNNITILDESHIICPQQKSREESDADNSRMVVGYILVNGSRTPYTGTYGDYAELLCREHRGSHPAIKHDPDTYSIQRDPRDKDFPLETIGRYMVISI